jgi:hypothetical protein
VAVRRDRSADLPAVDRATYPMLSFGAPRLIRVKRNRDNGAPRRTASDVGAEPLNAHTLIVARRGQ